jgi:hypothetical protein
MVRRVSKFACEADGILNRLWERALRPRDRDWVAAKM